MAAKTSQIHYVFNSELLFLVVDAQKPCTVTKFFTAPKFSYMNGVMTHS